MASLSFKKVDKEIIENILKENKPYFQEIKNPTLSALIKTTNNETISIFKNKTVLIQADNPTDFALRYKLIFKNNSQAVQAKQLPTVVKLISPEIINKEETILGCDEVGVGDFFGPLVTCCAYVASSFKDEYPKIYSKIKDSKKLTNSQIYELYEDLQGKIGFSVFIMDNTLYNHLYDLFKNTHKLKALAHNQALLNWFEANSQDMYYSKIVMDKFVEAKHYFSYLSDRKEVIHDKMEFHTKAEDKYIAVACASIIARYHFLEKIKMLELEFKVELPLGANNSVKLKVQKYKKNNWDVVHHFTKMHFNSKITN
ncbi:ribonuclease HIII [Spiroplasma culicicola]|uniref:Ribonuclease n=1 Tax=Spiroplasma culicicola AES-1 TaxID=1276246 RepID=W6A7I6_9MOLU|nr:ribonuclease HIII [Spiroplasma culicicola]AHI53103.1 ribonuclease HIII [Spiroplasma culicicola AES-1]